jgi:hypothetical protein
MVDIWLFHPKNFLKFYIFCSKEIFLGAFWLHAAKKKPALYLPKWKRSIGLTTTIG